MDGMTYMHLSSMPVKEYRKICAMIHPGRVGSTLVCTNLGNSPVFAAGEIFNVIINGIANWESFLSYLDVYDEMLARSLKSYYSQYGNLILHPPAQSVYLFEHKPFHSEKIPSISQAVNEFSARGVDSYIFLYRKNYIRRYVSYLISKISGVWHTATPDRNPFQLIIDINNCVDFEIGFTGGTLLSALDCYYKKFIPSVIEAIKLMPNLILNYEDHVERNPKVAFEQIQSFLGLDSSCAFYNCNYLKQNDFPLSSIILNYDDLVLYLSDTEYSILLND